MTASAPSILATTRYARVLSIAGSDSGGGAGIHPGQLVSQQGQREVLGAFDVAAFARIHERRGDAGLVEMLEQLGLCRRPVVGVALAVGDGADLTVGTPLVAGASVKATVLAHGKHDKVRIFKMRRRKHYQKRQGHRQNFTEIQISAVSA